MFSQKPKKQMSDVEKEALLNVAGRFKSGAEKSIGEKLANSAKKKVTVAADTTKGLEEGLEKAKEVLPQVEAASEANPMESENEPQALELASEVESLGMDAETMSEDELKSKLQELVSKYC